MGIPYLNYCIVSSNLVNVETMYTNIYVMIIEFRARLIFLNETRLSYSKISSDSNSECRIVLNLLTFSISTNDTIFALNTLAEHYLNNN